MSRISYSDEEDYPGQFNLWQANCTRSLRGKSGQAALLELEAALLALPNKRLARHVVACDGDVCAVGSVLLMRKAKELGSIDAAQAALEAEMGERDEQAYIETAELGEEVGMPRLVAWKLVALNDIEIDGRYVEAPGPNPKPLGWPEWNRYEAARRVFVEYTPEERYEQVLAWVRRQLLAALQKAEGVR